MATTPELHEPQIAAARAQAWHQAGDPVLTLEAARTFVNEHGLVLFAPRPLGAPAPSLVEATLGAAATASTPAEADIARGLVARLVAEGSAIPLALLGGPGELPDFVVSAAAFPFVFTLRGDKGWKRPPETSGAVKVTPLALRVFELLSERGALTVAEIVPEIGREVNASAVSRALSELWSLLRVFPALQQGEGETRWELTTTRFLKAVKAGANAGQPTALSALVSLYLGQVFLATEEEIAGFLSPLTARSRVRDVLHGLTAGRQLDEAVLEGKTMLYLPDSLPAFAPPTPAEAQPEAGAEEAQVSVPETTETAPVEKRIRRFEAKADDRPRAAREFRGKPAPRAGGFQGAKRSSSSREGASGRPPARFGGERSARGPAARSDRSDRPVRRREPGAEAGSAPFTRPWEEERRPRPRREGEERAPSRGPKEGSERRDLGARPPRAPRPGAEGESAEARRPKGGTSRPAFAPGGAQGSRPPFRREGGEGSRPPFRRKPSEGGPVQGRGFGGEGNRPSPRARALPPGLQGSGRPPRAEGRPPFVKREGGAPKSFGPRRDRGESSFAPREGRGGERKEFRGATDRPRGERPRSSGAGAGGPSRSFDRGPRRDAPSGAGGAGRGFSDRSVRGGDGPRGRPQGGPGDRQGPRPGPGGARAGGGFSRGPRQGGPYKGVAKGAAKGPFRGAAKGASRQASTPRRPEDEA